MNYRKAVLGLLAVFCVCGTAYCAVERMELVPPECVMTVRLSDSTKFIEQWKKSSLARLWSDPQMNEVFGNKEFVEALKEEMAQGKSEELAHLEWAELMMLKGEVILALRPGAKEPVIVAHMSEEDYNRSLEMDQRIAELKKGDDVFTVKKGTFQGAPLVQLITEKNKGGEKVKTTTWQSHVENTIISAESREFVEKTIVKIRKEGVKEPKELPELNLNMHIKKVIDELENKVPQPEPPQTSASGRPAPPPSPRPRQIFTALGMDAIDNLVINMKLKDDEMVVESNILGTDFTRGLFKLLVSEPSSLDLKVPFVPENALSYEVSRMDLRALWLEIPNSLTVLNPMYGAQYHFMLAALIGSLGIDIDKELLAHLDTQYISFSTADGDQAVNVTCVRLNDEQSVKATLAKLFSDTSNLRKGMGEILKIEDFRSSTMYVFDTKPSANTVGQPQPALTPAASEARNALTVGGGYMFFGAEAGVRMVLRSLDASDKGGKSFYSSRLVRELRSLAPVKCMGYSIVDWPAFITTYFSDENRDVPVAALKSITSTSKMGVPGAKTPGMFKNADYSKLPSGSHMASFFGPSFSYNTRDANGIYGKMILRYSSRGKK